MKITRITMIMGSRKNDISSKNKNKRETRRNLSIVHKSIFEDLLFEKNKSGKNNKSKLEEKVI